MLHRGLAGLPLPRTLALAVGEAGPGEDVVIRQVQICRVHRKLADELQQASQAVKQPLQDRMGRGGRGRTTARPYPTEINKQCG